MNLFHILHLEDDTVELPEEEAHHAVHVLRLRPGDSIGLLDGKGTKAAAQLLEVGKHYVTAQILSRTRHERERQAHIHLAVAPTKHQERLEWMVEKAVELGLDRITPVITQRTERTRLRTDRLQRIAIAAMKQSQRTWLPLIDEPITLNDLLREELPQQRFFGWCEGEHTTLMHLYTPTTHALVVIGPEGDLSQEEAEQLRAVGCTAVSIGDARLRTETAALAAVTWMSLAQQR